MLHRGLRVPRRRLQVRCDARAVQLKVVVVLVVGQGASCAIPCPIQVLLNRLLVFQRVHERLIVDGGWVRLVEVAVCPTAAVGLLGAGLLEHAGRGTDLWESVLIEEALLPHTEHLGSGWIGVGDLVLVEPAQLGRQLWGADDWVLANTRVLEQWIHRTGLVPMVLAEELLLRVRRRFCISADLERAGLMGRGR